MKGIAACGNLFLLALLLLMPVFAPTSALAEDEHYYIPPQQFNASMQIMQMGFANLIALFRNATGSFTYDPTSKTINHLKLAIDASSLIANSNDSQSQLNSLLQLDASPEITFVESEPVVFGDGKTEIKGNLKLHGASKPVTLEATLNHVGKSPEGGGLWNKEGKAIGLSLHTSIKRADFGITNDAEKDPRFGDTITFQFEIQGLGE